MLGIIKTVVDTIIRDDGEISNETLGYTFSSIFGDLAISGPEFKTSDSEECMKFIHDYLVMRGINLPEYKYDEECDSLYPMLAMSMPSLANGCKFDQKAFKERLNKIYGYKGNGKEAGFEKMNKEQLFEAFKGLFPSWVERVKSYKKIGSRTLAIVFYDHVTPTGAVSEQTSSRVFLYNNPNNWQFGTKLWRKRPERIPKKEKREKNEEKIQNGIN